MILFQTKQERFKASGFEMMFNYLSENLLQSELWYGGIFLQLPKIQTQKQAND